MDRYEDILDYCPAADRQHDLNDFPYDSTAPECDTTDDGYPVSVACSNDCGMELGTGLICSRRKERNSSLPQQ